ncbi:hypothetical protein N7457_009773 [Penicillium paradoxum]|uniref:uncharacterized protein n=1 Tax=Penicillium paradoxum TaxID=176176 RepID=UPI002547D336|nr:uncharacterized protein N7457_009773 [Penicillium paradoxum]KAJ5774877.1 hypothetical protein N7457_009773 [Penicillium paradoxum]
MTEITTSVPPVSGSSSTSPGTIAGAVVGSVAGAGGIVAGAMFLILKRKKHQQAQSNDARNVTDQKDQSCHSGWEKPQAVEVEGSTPAHGAAAVSGNNAPRELNPTHLIFELPTLDEANRH